MILSRRRVPLGPLLVPLLVAALVAVPVAGLCLTALQAGLSGASLERLSEFGVGAYVSTSVHLALLVVVGTVLIGVTTGWICASYRFPGSRWFGGLLVLPLAMPAYVIAYAYADLLQFSGPVQTWMRETFALAPRSYWFPEIRSLEGAACVFALVLFPYVYLPARVAFAALPRSLFEAARLAGSTPFSAFRRVAWPLAWPAIAGGALLTIMESLADYGAVSYFAVDSFTVGIYKAWLGYGDRTAAVQLSLLLLVAAALLMVAERALRGRRGYAVRGGVAAPREPIVLTGARAWACTMVCAVPVVLGFVVPVAALLHVALRDAEVHDWWRYVAAARSSFVTAGVAAFLVTGIALMLAYAARRSRDARVAVLNRFAGLGYAIPGAVIALGTLIPLARLDNQLDAWAEQWWGVDIGLVLTGSLCALWYALVVRFLAVGLQNVETGFARLTPSLDEAARTLGVTGVGLLRRVHAPLLARPLAVAGLLVFVDALKELPATLALRPFNYDTLATQAYNFARDERLGEAAVPSLIIVLIAVVPTLLLSASPRDRRDAGQPASVPRFPRSATDPA